METFLITKEEYHSLSEKLNNIIELLNSKNRLNPLSETWLDISDVCLLLKISKRTLQAYRDNGILPFSKVGGKIYFKSSDIEEYLLKYYNLAIR